MDSGDGGGFSCRGGNVVMVVVVKNYDDCDEEKPLLLLGCHVQRHAGKMDSGDGQCGGFSCGSGGGCGNDMMVIMMWWWW